ncbi:MAG: DNA-processing protein DprA [Pseudomonadales bacterium]
MPDPKPPPPSREAAAWSLLLDRLSRRDAVAQVQTQGNVFAALSAEPSGTVRGFRLQRAIRRRIEACQGAAVGLLCRGEAGWPERLSAIPDAPALLHYRGDLRALERTAIAIVGSRRASRAGLNLAESLAQDLGRIGVVVVSGLALGVDSAAHRGALGADAVTLAVLGSGVDRVTPVSNTPLARDVLAGGGLLVSEYPPGAPAAPFHFPERNRLIAGLSLGVVVVEASARSGSLITARCAGEQGREVMAMPATPGLPNAAGSNRLLKQGAALVENAEDVLAALGRDLSVPGADGAGAAADLSSALTPELARVLDRLDASAQSLDSLAARTGLDAQACAVALTELEIGGFVQRLTDGYIRRLSGY